jgi:hypothetical protein
MSAVKKNVKSRQPSQPRFLTPKSAQKMTWLAKFWKISTHSPSDFAFTFFNSYAHPQIQFFVFFLLNFAQILRRKLDHYWVLNLPRVSRASRQPQRFLTSRRSREKSRG